jgi:hypothetical protein
MKFQKGKPKTGGRRQGSLNKATREIKAFASGVLEDPSYRANLKQRIQQGKAQEMEKLLYLYAYGRPKEQVEEGDAQADPKVVIYIPDNGRAGHLNS